MKRFLAMVVLGWCGWGLCAEPADSTAAVPVAKPFTRSEETLSVNGRSIGLRMKVPAEAAVGKPWLWVGEFYGHLGALEDSLAGQGWHVVYTPVSNQFGSPAAMTAWEEVYGELTSKRGLSPRPVLLGISRGGLYVNAWTRLHPDRVSVLILDNGVCDIRSWPGGIQLTAKGKGSAGDWGKYKSVFGFASDEEAQAKSVRPTDGMEAAVKAAVMLISVHGTADKVVPYEDNAKCLVDYWQAQGGKSRTFAKEGGDHHPHGLKDYSELLQILNEAVKP